MLNPCFKKQYNTQGKAAQCDVKQARSSINITPLSPNYTFLCVPLISI